MKKILLPLVIFSSLLFSSCGKSTPKDQITPTPAPQIFELSAADKPIVSLVPRSDGHELKLKIEKIPQDIVQIDYELLYTAVDENMEIEKGAGDTIKVDSQSIERKLLLGTSSCTNGCKYKYDNGVTGGTLSLTLITKNNQIAIFETPFSLKTGKEIKANQNQIILPVEEKSMAVTNLKLSTYYLILRDFGTPPNPNTSLPGYSLFDSGSF